LLVSIGLTALAAVDAQRTVRSQQAVERRALREYANFAAWSYAQHLTEALNSLEREAIGAVNHGDDLHTRYPVPRARDLVHYLPYDASCECLRARAGPNPETFFALQIGRPDLDVSVNTHVNPSEGWAVDRRFRMPVSPETVTDYPAEDRAWIVDSLTRRVRGAREPDHGFNLVVGNVGGRTSVLTYTLMPTTWGDTMVYGARYSADGLRRVIAGVLDAGGLLPTTFTEGRRNRDLLVVRVFDGTGHRLFDSSPGASSPLDARLELPARAGALSIQTLIREEVAGTLLIGGLPRSRLPFLLGLLGLAAALSVVAVMQLRREGELAALRANFVSSVSHELRTPLAQIRLYIDTIRLGRAKTEADRDWSLAHIERETTRLGHLVENVLRFSTLGGDELAAMEPADAGVEVAKIVEEFRPLAATRQAEVVVEIQPGATVVARPDALRHVVLNLLDNAIKYGRAGQTVRVEVRQTGHTILIAVSDEGPGVPTAERAHIWGAFSRGTTGRARGGSGIGLTIVRQIAEQHGGRAVVEDAHGGGARFVVELPAAAPASANGRHT
jgi:signal transduction histidine kinase